MDELKNKSVLRKTQSRFKPSMSQLPCHNTDMTNANNLLEKKG
jgi:hypothetical protein